MAPLEVRFISGGTELLDQVEVMWRKLTLDASTHSEHFHGYFANKPWEERKAELAAKAAKGSVVVDIAAVGDRRVGYCISSVSAEGIGELDSLFVDEDCRGQKVGERLAQRSVEWMRRRGARTMLVLTVYGNEDVLPFYARQGFLPMMVLLQHVER